MNKIRAMVVDDEPIARERVLSLLQQEDDMEIVAECGDGAQAVAAIQHHTPDLVFLDVQMPGVDGFGVINAIGADRMPTVIFVTAYDEYALRAFEVHALDYLLKPFGRERFRETLKRAGIARTPARGRSRAPPARARQRHKTRSAEARSPRRQVRRARLLPAYRGSRLDRGGR
jgi:two-component system LytT family response regulator